MYRFQPQVYLTVGAAGACIYDLPHRRLWHASLETAELLRRACSGEQTAFSAAESEILRQMCDAELLAESQTPAPPHDISELRQAPAIRQAWIELCTDCNLRCRHCYNEASGQGIRMTEDDFRLVCQRLQEAAVDDVQFIGGEPFRHPALRSILETAAKQFRRIEIFTNGTLLDDAWCRLLQALKIRAALSVYSDQPEIHDAVTGIRGSHAAVMHGVDLLRQYGIPFRTAAVAMKGNASCENADIVRMSGRGNLRLLTPELLRQKFITKETFRRRLDPQRVQKAVSGNPCFSRKIYIAADLTVYPCVMERRMQHGSLRENPLSRLLRQDIMQMNRDSIPQCSICEYRYACAPCLPDSLSDNPAKKPYFCTYDAASGIWKDPAAQIAAVLGGNP